LERKLLHGEETLALEQEILTKKMEMELAALDLSEQEKQNIREKYGVEQEKLVKETGEATTKIDEIVGNEKVQAAMAIGNAIANLATTLFEENKAAQIGAVGIQTITGAAGAFAASSGAYPAPFGPILGGISAAAVVAGGVKAIADISASKPGKRGGRPKISSPAATTPVSTSAIGDAGANNAARLGIDPSLGSQATQNAGASASGSASGGVVFSEEKYNDFQGQVAFKEEKTTVS
jgi:hypothetical protein